MLKLLTPCLVVNTIYDINLALLKQRGIRGIIFDLDNTIVAWNSPELGPDMRAWLQQLSGHELKVCLLSNNGNKRVKAIADQCGAPFVARALKPARTGFRQAVHTLGLTPAEVAVVGDQLFTDMLGGNRLGLFTIWVQPLASQEFIGTKITRQFEKLAIRLLRASGRL
ncbi:YqeG family HAD IIIA-type phosphatase [Sporomusa termitida]|uniref:HAD phosphatase, family IIIA n=1 Tax=Sporomusa termitida TaxID=2377 RepID=A0A517DSP8_9FIRM|nr:YqeG family HAD IIIA-type phosphatase [Sporomusa termitida]QDR80316.1 HAD phosphatase, family IIIA [Sporomusa termitida]